MVSPRSAGVCYEYGFPALCLVAVANHGLTQDHRDGSSVIHAACAGLLARYGICCCKHIWVEIVKSFRVHCVVKVYMRLVLKGYVPGLHGERTGST